MNGIDTIFTPFNLDFIQRNTPRATPVHLAIATLLSLLNIVFAVALLRWRRWGAYGFIASAIAALVMNLSMGFGTQALPGLVGGCALMFVALFVGGPNKAWTRLK